jgi:hypothetical protein
MNRICRFLRGLLYGAAGPQHPAAAPIAASTTAAQAGEQWVASVRALVTLAQEREDAELMGQLRWMRFAFARWSESSEHLKGRQLQTDLDEVAQELILDFRKLVELAVQRRDENLLAHLRLMQSAWVRWVDSSTAPPLAITTSRRSQHVRPIGR